MKKRSKEFLSLSIWLKTLRCKNSFTSFQKIVSQFLDIELINLGWLPNSQLITNSILTRKPFILNNKADAQLNSLLSDITSNIVRPSPLKQIVSDFLIDEMGELLMHGYTQKSDDKNELINKNMSIVKRSRIITWVACIKL